MVLAKEASREVREGGSMTKTFCDWCEREIKAVEGNLARLKTASGVAFEDLVCPICADKVKDVRAHLKNPLQVKK